MSSENPETRAKMEKIMGRMKREADAHGVPFNSEAVRKDLSRYAREYDRKQEISPKPKDTRTKEEALEQAKANARKNLKQVTIRANVDPDAKRWV